MQKWEYKLVVTSGGREVVSVDLKELAKPLPITIDYLNQLGQGGWELVGAFGGPGWINYSLKRPLPHED